MIYWPALLPKPSQRYSSGIDPKLAVTEFDRNFRQRQKYSGADELIQVSWRFDQLQYDSFRTFVDSKLVQGSLEFTADIVGLDGIESRVVKMQGGKYAMTYVSNGWYDVSSVLIGQPAPNLDSDLYEFLLTLDTSDIAGFCQACEVIFVYIEQFYGDSSASPQVTAFLSKYI